VTGQVQVCAGGVGGLGYQVGWWAKCRRPVFGDWVAGRCVELIAAKAAGRGWPMVALQIMADHVRLFVKAHPSDCPSPAADEFQGFTSRYLRAEFAHLRSRLPTSWSGSYLAATADAVPAQTVRRYTGTQDERRWRTGRAR
jgi:REP-associated tyrosine transposase